MDGGNRRVAVSSKLFAQTVLDPKEAEDERLERAERAIAHLVGDSASEKEVHDNLQKYSSKGAQQNEEVCLGLLYRILTGSAEPKLSQQYLRDLNLISRDGVKLPIERVNYLILEKFHKLLDGSRMQVLFFVREMVRAGVAMADMLCFSLMRQIAGGDVSPKNMWLADQVLSLFVDNKQWFLSFPILLQTAVYTYLRVIVDHHGPRFAALRQREVDFTASIIREKFDVVMAVGRDLVRLLQGVARIPEFAAIWTSILHNPSSLSSNFSGVPQLMRCRTRRTFIQCRLTPDMEKKLTFLTSTVKFGQQKRYQDWFQRTYLGTPESQSLRCDLIRYICCIIHPPNEVLCSDIIPRWAVIGWLLTTCTSNVDASNAKLSLFYDWLFFDPETDNIMNIEPAILVMYHSIRPHPSITATLIDFLCRIMKNFSIPLADKVRSGIHNALRTITSKRVLPSLSPLFDNPKLDEELRGMVRESFGEFCSKTSVEAGNNLIPQGFAAHHASPHSPSLPPIHSVNHVGPAASSNFSTSAIEDVADSLNHKLSESSDIAEGKFSEDEEDVEPSPIVVAEEKTPKVPPLPSKRNASTPSQLLNSSELAATRARLHSTTRLLMAPIDIEPFIAQVESQSLKDEILAYIASDDEEENCGIMERIVQEILGDDDFADSEVAAPIAAILCQLLIDVFNSDIFPQELTEDAMAASVESPLFVIFRILETMAEEDPSRSTLLTLITEMHKRQRKIGYLMLYFLKVDKSHDSNHEDGKMAPYRDFIKSIIESGSASSTDLGSDCSDISSCLLSDLRCCVDDDARIFCLLLPDIYAQFSGSALGNADLIHLVVSSIDAAQLQDIVCHVLLGHLTMFRKENLMGILNASLDWESIEQIFLWQIVAAHDCVSAEHVLPLLPKLEYTQHAEALTSLLLLLKRETPTLELVRHVFNREQKDGDIFVISILRHWVADHEEKLAQLVQQQFQKSLQTQPSNPLSSPRKRLSASAVQSFAGARSHGAGSNGEPTVETILAHLEHLRRTCPSNLNTFFFRDSLQSALSQVQQACSEAQKMRYSDLLSLADDFEDPRVTRNLRHVAARRANQAAANSTGGSGTTTGRQHAASNNNSSERRGLKRDRAGSKSSRSSARSGFAEDEESDDSDNDDDGSSSSSSSDSEEEQSGKTLPPRKRNPPPLPDKINLF